MLNQVLKQEVQPSVLGLDSNTNFKFCELLKSFTVYLSILTLIFSLKVIAKFKSSLYQICRHSLNINFFCILFMKNY